MPVELAVATPTYFDLTVVGLDALPAPGEERFAGDLRRAPGGGAIIAVAGARLGLATALVAPLGDDGEGDFVRTAVREEGVQLVECRSPRTPTTIIIPLGAERSMITVDPSVRAPARDVAALEPTAVALSLDQLYAIPPGAAGYVTCGEDDANAFRGRVPKGLDEATALFVNEREALALTGADDAERAGESLAGLVETVVVTLGAAGALAWTGGSAVRADAPAVKPVDTTGAGDLLVAAYAWATARGAEPHDRLRWAVLYASLSTTTPTAVGGALGEAELLAEGASRGLAPPDRAPDQSAR